MCPLNSTNIRNMGNLIDKLSLQNLLRQVFCGIVFFVPFLVGEGCFCNVVKNSIIEASVSAGCIFLGVACAVGTLIYHLEKNLYSYPLQIQHKKNRSCIVSCILIVVTLLGTLWFNVVLQWAAVFIFGVGFIYMSVVLCKINGLKCKWIKMVDDCLKFTRWKKGIRKALLNETREIWSLEECILHPCELSFQEKATIKKIAVWSDFIHCGQSCCFALLLGTLVVDAGCENNVNEWLYIIPLVVLAMIVLIDYHRYQHVRFLVCRDKDASQS